MHGNEKQLCCTWCFYWLRETAALEPNCSDSPVHAMGGRLLALSYLQAIILNAQWNKSSCPFWACPCPKLLAEKHYAVPSVYLQGWLQRPPDHQQRGANGGFLPLCSRNFSIFFKEESREIFRQCSSLMEKYQFNKHCFEMLNQTTCSYGEHHHWTFKPHLF